jgi:hypothetical protein
MVDDQEEPWNLGALGFTECLSSPGATCEVVLAPCVPSPCKNSGVCKESEDYESFSCICPTGWQGEADLVLTGLGQGVQEVQGSRVSSRQEGVGTHL